LFVQQTQSGALEQTGRGVFRLRLDDVSASVSTFTDRPRRRAGQQSLHRFVGAWGSYGFAADPPNAALVLSGAPRSRDVALLTLSRPRYDRAARTLTYVAKPLRGTGPRSLAALSRRRDPVRPLEFADASLFIDDAGSQTVYQRLAIQVFVTEPQVPSRPVLQLDPGEAGVRWSLGRPTANNPGLLIEPLSGELSLPLHSWMLSPQVLSFQTPSSQERSAFTITTFLEAEADTGFVTFIYNGAPGLQLNLSLGDGPMEEIGPGEIVLPWEEG
jgi:hypothetical protein